MCKFYSLLLWNKSAQLKDEYLNKDEYVIDLERGIEKLACNKAVGPDRIPGEWLKYRQLRKDITSHLRSWIKKWVDDEKIPEHWAWAKLILISKENNKNPAIENTRPIAILPAITKVFEQSTLPNFEKVAYTNGFLMENQRGFRPGTSTGNNIADLINFWKTAQSDKEKKLLVFIDIKKAYDSVNREKLLKILDEADISENLINTMRDFYNKTKLIYKGITIHTNKGLFQGSWLSPILFNFYINKLLIDINTEKWKAIVFADDIVMMIKSKKYLNESLIKLKLCREGIELEINEKIWNYEDT